MAGARRTILVVALVAAAAAGGGLFATQFINSPAEAAAKTAPPPAGPITVTVGKSELTATVTTRGDLGFTDSVKITLPPSTSGAPGLITGRIPKAGSKISEGGVLIEVSGRPVIALGGSIPGYRTIGPGSVGSDVEQLQKALNRLGFQAGKEDGVYDAEVAAAVVALYRKAGYAPPAPDKELVAAKDAAQQALTRARQGLTDAENALDAADIPPSNSAKLAADGAVSAAEAALETARNTGTPPDQAAVEAAQQKVSAAGGALQAAQQKLTEAEQALTRAEDKLRSAKADQRAAAQNERDIARQARDTAQQEVDAANAAANEADDALTAANAPGAPDQAAINAAENQVAVARAQREELLEGPDTSAARGAVTAAQKAVDEAATTLARSKKELLTPVPVNEIVYLAELPRRVDEILAKAGDGVTEPVMSVSGTALQVRATVSEDEAGLLSKGMKGVLTVPGIGTVEAKIVSLKTDPENQGSWVVLLDPGDVTDEQAQALRGQNVKVDIEVGATAGEVLTVPVGALFSDTDGTPRVEVLQADGTTRFQRLRIGLTADGKVEVHPIADDGADLGESDKSLQDGSLVVVGR
ncbi:hypothetical protein D1871_23325 [Nakamurella silvestris]|nr:hypothetical protein D1871_23325 [Nakamurella silvestris]